MRRREAGGREGGWGPGSRRPALSAPASRRFGAAAAAGGLGRGAGRSGRASHAVQCAGCPGDGFSPLARRSRYCLTRGRLTASSCTLPADSTGPRTDPPHPSIAGASPATGTLVPARGGRGERAVLHITREPEPPRASEQAGAWDPKSPSHDNQGVAAEPAASAGRTSTRR